MKQHCLVACCIRYIIYIERVLPCKHISYDTASFLDRVTQNAWDLGRRYDVHLGPDALTLLLETEPVNITVSVYNYY